MFSPMPELPSTVLRIITILTLAGTMLVGCSLFPLDSESPSMETETESEEPGGAEGVDDARLRNAEREPSNWLTYGGSYGEQRFSRLQAINDSNVGELGLAWSFETGTKRGLEATPIVVDGVIYTTGTWSVVFAIDARTGKQIWRHDPEVPRTMGGRVCCDVVNRGVAIYRGRVYVGTLDGRLQALDSATGEVI